VIGNLSSNFFHIEQIYSLTHDHDGQRLYFMAVNVACCTVINDLLAWIVTFHA
jgi:hypothetical protein